MIAFLFPGQGAQRPGLLADCVRLLGASDVLDTAGTILERDVLLDDTAEALHEPEIVQRNVFLAGMCGAHALRRAGIVPSAAAGHSIGAFVAATVAGVFEFAEALGLVSLRGSAMARALGPGYGMGAIVGLPQSAVESIVRHVDSEEAALAIGAINAPDQIVVSGMALAVDRALEIALQLGARDVRRLAIPVASHTPLMSGVHDELLRAFARVTPCDPSVPVAANVDGRALFRGEDVVNDLIESIVVPVRWYDATQMLFERGVRCFVEAFLDDTLTTLAERTFDGATAVSLGRDGLATSVHLARRAV